MHPSHLGGAAAATALRRTAIASKAGETLPSSESESESDSETKPTLVRKATLETEEDIKNLISLAKTKTITKQIERKIKEENSTPSTATTSSTAPPRSPRSGSSPPKIESPASKRRSRAVSQLTRSPHQFFDRKRAASLGCTAEELAKTSSSLEGFETDSDSMDTSNEDESSSYISTSSGGGSIMMSSTRNITIPKAEKTLVSIVTSETKITSQELIDATKETPHGTAQTTPIEELLPKEKRLTRYPFSFNLDDYSSSPQIRTRLVEYNKRESVDSADFIGIDPTFIL